jgi:hypothetical protein
MTGDSALDAQLEEMARALAAKHRLVDENGVVWCWQCSERLALIPSLHCGLCLGAQYAKLGIVAPLCVNRQQEQSQSRKAQNG